MSARRNRPLTLALLVVVLVLAACSGAPSGQGGDSSSTPSTSAAATVSSIDKSKVMSPTESAAIDTTANDFLTTSPDKSPGLWLAVWDPAKGYYEQAYGDAVADTTKATVADHSWIGSITKTVFATAVLQQVAAGKLALTDTVQILDAELAAEYPAVGALTVAQLLGMTSGIPDFADAAVAAVAADHARSFTGTTTSRSGSRSGRRSRPGRRGTPRRTSSSWASSCRCSPGEPRRNW